MRRRSDSPGRQPVPDWCRTYVAADWADKLDEASEGFADLAAVWGEHRARQVRSHSRWSAARCRWAAGHGYALHELRGSRRG